MSRWLKVLLHVAAAFSLMLGVLLGTAYVSENKAQAHTPKYSAACTSSGGSTLSVDLQNYNASGTNHVKVVAGGATKVDKDFGSSYSGSWTWDGTTDITYTITVTAWDDPKGTNGWSFTKSGTIGACVATPDATADVHVTDPTCTSDGSAEVVGLVHASLVGKLDQSVGDNKASFKSDDGHAFSDKSTTKTVSYTIKGKLTGSQCFDWNWKYNPPTCEAGGLIVVYPGDIPAGSDNKDVNIRVKNLATGEVRTFNFHDSDFITSGKTVTYDVTKHPDWPGWTWYEFQWTQVHGTNYHWEGSVTCGQKPVVKYQYALVLWKVDESRAPYTDGMPLWPQNYTKSVIPVDVKPTEATIKAAFPNELQGSQKCVAYQGDGYDYTTEQQRAKVDGLIASGVLKDYADSGVYIAHAYYVNSDCATYYDAPTIKVWDQKCTVGDQGVGQYTDGGFAVTASDKVTVVIKDSDDKVVTDSSSLKPGVYSVFATTPKGGAWNTLSDGWSYTDNTKTTIKKVVTVNAAKDCTVTPPPPKPSTYSWGQETWKCGDTVAITKGERIDFVPTWTEDAWVQVAQPPVPVQKSRPLTEAEIVKDCTPQPDVKVDTSQFVDGQWKCGDTRVLQTQVKTTTTTPYVIKWNEDGTYAFVLDTANAKVATETFYQYRQLSAAEINSACKGQIDASLKCVTLTIHAATGVSPADATPVYKLDSVEVAVGTHTVTVGTHKLTLEVNGVQVDSKTFTAATCSSGGLGGDTGGDVGSNGPMVMGITAGAVVLALFGFGWLVWRRRFQS